MHKITSSKMSTKDTVFYSNKQVFTVDFTGKNISSEGGVVLLEKIERKHHIIKNLSGFISDKRHPSYIEHDVYKLLKQRVFMQALGYQDANDADKLKGDTLFTSVFTGGIASQPTISRFENTMTKQQIFTLLYAWLDAYIQTLAGRKTVTIDIDGTDAETYGHQQMSLFNGFYGHTMFNELYFHDGDTGQIILPVLRPGNAHSNWWYVSILKRIVRKIRSQYPGIKIVIRADSGFSTPKFYKLAKDENLEYAFGIPSNNVLKTRVETLEQVIRELYAGSTDKYQHFTSAFDYQAGTWEEAQQCYAKVEYTGKGMNTRFFVSNFKSKNAREIYFDFYVKRGDASENRIKEVKTMCYADRLSNHNFWANFMRLITSSLAYETMRIIKTKIAKTTHEKAKTWQVDNIRLLLLKIGGFIQETKRRIIVKLSESAVYKNLFLEILHQ